MTIGGIAAIAFVVVLAALAIRNTWGKKWDSHDGPPESGVNGNDSGGGD